MPIQKAAGQIETFTLGGSTVETHDATALIETHNFFQPNTLRVIYADGTPANNSFASFPRANVATLVINTATGKWTSSAGTTGTLSGAQLNAIKNNQTALRNGLENIANAIGLTPGTVVAWT